MKKTFALSRSTAFAVIGLVGVCTSGHAATVTLGSASVIPGFGVYTVPVTLEPALGEQVAAAQWDLVFDSDVLTLETIATGPVAAAAGKSVSYSTIVPGTIRVLVSGFNMDTMSDGIVATAAFSSPMGSPAGGQPVDMDSVVLSDPYGSPVPCVAVSGLLTIDDTALSTGLGTWFGLCLGCAALLIPGMACLRRQKEAPWALRK